MASEWVSGYYKQVLSNQVIGACVVNGKQIRIYCKTFQQEKGSGTWTIDDFGEANKTVAEMTGQTNYNIKLSFPDMEDPDMKEVFGIDNLFGVISEDGKKITMTIFSMIVEYIWITEEEAEEMRSNGDPANCPPCHHDLQPGEKGKFIWVSGPPGHGKSTTCRTLMETKGFVYYEGDCFICNTNPFIEPSKGKPVNVLFHQKELHGISKERIKITEEASVAYMEWINKTATGEYFDLDNNEAIKQVFTLMCEDIDVQKRRIGGDWAVCHAVASKSHRDLIRSKLGPDLVFVLLEMDEELCLERLKDRKNFEGFVERWENIGNAFQSAAENEEKIIVVKLTQDMTPIDVVEKILDNDVFKKQGFHSSTFSNRYI